MPLENEMPPGPNSTVVRQALKDQEKLWSEVLKLAAIVSSALASSVQALRENRTDLAGEVKLDERTVDTWEVQIEQECVRILARYGPTASDLRRVIAAMRISSELERMADLAEHIANRVRKRVAIAEIEPVPATLEVSGRCLARDGQGKSRCPRPRGRRTGPARHPRGSGDRPAPSYRPEGAQGRHPATAPSSRYLAPPDQHRAELERVADHASNIAETVVYLKEGDIVRHSSNTSGRSKPTDSP